MKLENVRILSIAHEDAPTTLTSEQIETRLEPTMSRLGITAGIIRKLTGVEARKVWREDFPPSEGATAAAEKALDAAGIDRSKVGVIVNTSVCRDPVEPATATVVHGNLGLSRTCLNFDVSNACLAFINGMQTVSNMIESGFVDYGIVVNSENTRHALEKTIERLLSPLTTWQVFRDNFATLTLGCGAAAMVLGRSNGEPGEHRFLGGVTMAATQYSRLCLGTAESMVTNTKKLFHHGLEVAVGTWEKAKDALGWTSSDLDHFILHQVGKAHTETFARLLGLDLAKIFRLYPQHGNIGPASVPIVLSKLYEAGKLKPGDRIALMGIGSGINCSMAEIVW
ncbi:MAG: 3-oxoacyl-ACP synthase III [Thermoanaerobaculales bacterium]|nr:3-oxoacyl-ACP synthase III [Thermoanaerobaculales bacterium]